MSQDFSLTDLATIRRALAKFGLLTQQIIFCKLDQIMKINWSDFKPFIARGNGHMQIVGVCRVSDYQFDSQAITGGAIIVNEAQDERSRFVIVFIRQNGRIVPALVLLWPGAEVNRIVETIQKYGNK